MPTIVFDKNVYSIQTLKAAICMFMDKAVFTLNEIDTKYVVEYKNKKNCVFKEEDFVEELHYLSFLEEQKKITEPTRLGLIEGFIKKFSDGLL